MTQRISVDLLTTMAKETTHPRLSTLKWLVFLILISSSKASEATTAGDAKSVTVESECAVDGTCTALPDKDHRANNCEDLEENCVFWAKSGECDANPNYMLRNCPNACNVCSFLTAAAEAGNNYATDLSPLDKEIKRRLKEKEKKEEESVDLTETPYGVAQVIDKRDHDVHVQLEGNLQNMTDYMDRIVFQDEGHAKVKAECKNR